jgi:cell division septal protein FtsQ
MQDKNYKSSNLIKRKKKILLLKMWVIFIIAILIIGGGAYFSNTENVKISTISINDTTFFNKQEAEKIAQEELANTHFLIFGKNNILLLPRNNIEKRIKEYTLLYLV